jgi:alkanesulfonate monooxygenase SsuD/methylene tetrahydromethanopterin reductase-like flavin-dependent oxidoreductase (luciferase family)
MVPVSILDLVPVILGETPREALRKSLDLAQHAETFGYKRYWVAEHHNMTGIASAATSVVISYLAGGTSMMRVGSGGIMLPNHSPLVIAEQFGTLESLYPGRIDLGLGRAPGTDQRTLQALRRTSVSADSFPEDVLELMLLLGDTKPGQPVRAVRGAGGKLQPPINDIEDYWTAAEKRLASRMLKYSIVGSSETVRKGLKNFVELTQPDELMIVTSLYDHPARIRSYEIVAHVCGSNANVSVAP